MSKFVSRSENYGLDTNTGYFLHATQEHPFSRVQLNSNRNITIRQSKSKNYGFDINIDHFQLFLHATPGY
jgi:hypothetical protein